MVSPLDQRTFNHSASWVCYYGHEAASFLTALHIREDNNFPPLSPRVVHYLLPCSCRLASGFFGPAIEWLFDWRSVDGTYFLSNCKYRICMPAVAVQEGISLHDVVGEFKNRLLLHWYFSYVSYTCVVIVFLGDVVYVMLTTLRTNSTTSVMFLVAVNICVDGMLCTTWDKLSLVIPNTAHLDWGEVHVYLVLT